MHHYIGCRTCTMCRIGYTQMCLNGSTVYGTGANGGHEDYLICPAYTCVKMPDGLDFDEGAACSCGTGTAFHALKRLRLAGDDHHRHFRPGAGRSQWHDVCQGDGRPCHRGGRG